MPNECTNTNTITIVSGSAVKLNTFIESDLQMKKFRFYNPESEGGGEFEYIASVKNVLKRGKTGIVFVYLSDSFPPLEWLQEVVGKYPEFWIKNEWIEEGGKAGIWIGKDGGENIESFEWTDLCLEEKYFLFSEEDHIGNNKTLFTNVGTNVDVDMDTDMDTNVDVDMDTNVDMDMDMDTNVNKDDDMDVDVALIASNNTSEKEPKNTYCCCCL